MMMMMMVIVLINLLISFHAPVIPDLRRSPRIRTFARRHSFYCSSSRSHSRRPERALSSSQPSVPARVSSPMRLLFGAAESPESGRPDGSRLPSDSSVFQVDSLSLSLWNIHTRMNLKNLLLICFRVRQSHLTHVVQLSAAVPGPPELPEPPPLEKEVRLTSRGFFSEEVLSDLPQIPPRPRRPPSVCRAR